MVGRINDSGSVEPLPQGRQSPSAVATGDHFESFLQNVTTVESPVTISQHAKGRMAQRNIELSPDDMHRISDAIDTAASKGSRESLMILDNVNYLVSVRNRTVVTAVPSGENKVFTNIDSAVVL